MVEGKYVVMKVSKTRVIFQNFASFFASICIKELFTKLLPCDNIKHIRKNFGGNKSEKV